MKRKALAGADGLGVDDERYQKMRKLGFSSTARAGTLLASDLPQAVVAGVPPAAPASKAVTPLVKPLRKARGGLAPAVDGDDDDYSSSSVEDVTPLGIARGLEIENLVDGDDVGGSVRRKGGRQRASRAAGSRDGCGEDAARGRHPLGPRAGEEKTASAAAEGLHRGKSLLEKFSAATDGSKINEVSLSSAVGQLRHSNSMLCKTRKWELVDDCSNLEKQLQAVTKAAHALKAYTTGRIAKTEQAAKALLASYTALKTDYPDIKIPVCVRSEVLVMIDLASHVARDDFQAAAGLLTLQALSGGFEGDVGGGARTRRHALRLFASVAVERCGGNAPLTPGSGRASRARVVAHEAYDRAIDANTRKVCSNSFRCPPPLQAKRSLRCKRLGLKRSLTVFALALHAMIRATRMMNCSSSFVTSATIRVERAGTATWKRPSEALPPS